jgi:hypothetical protein
MIGKYSPDNFNPPTRIHSTLIEAKNEAARLAEKHPGFRFVIFQGSEAAMCPVNPVQWIKL